jgi:hypothetical protein
MTVDECNVFQRWDDGILHAIVLRNACILQGCCPVTVSVRAKYNSNVADNNLLIIQNALSAAQPNHGSLIQRCGRTQNTNKCQQTRAE